MGRIMVWLMAMGLAVSALGQDVRATDTWTQWRGPTRDGWVNKAHALPEALTEASLTERWRVTIADGYSGPLVTDDRIFTVETLEQRDEVVRAWDRATGKALWERSWEGVMRVPFFAARNGSWVRATPAFDGESLYVAGMRDVLVCLDAKDGKVRWQVDFTERFKSPLPSFGFVSSPLVMGDAVYVQAGAGLCKLDKATGATRWRSITDGGGMYGSAFASPVWATIHGIEQLVVQTRERLVGVDPADGRELWSVKVPAFRGMNILTPVVWKDRIFTSSYGGGAFLYRLHHEAAAAPGDGKDQPASEAGAGGEGDAEAAARAWRVEEVWRNRTQAYMCSPVLVDGHVYLSLRNQRFACIRLEDGEVLWQSDRKVGDYTSLTTDGKRVLALTWDGQLMLFDADPTAFKLRGSLQVAEAQTWAHIAPAGRDLVIREQRSLAVHAWSEAPRE